MYEVKGLSTLGAHPRALSVNLDIIYSYFSEFRVGQVSNSVYSAVHNAGMKRVPILTPRTPFERLFATISII